MIVERAAAHRQVSSMWSFYGIELSDVSVTRAALLLRILVVDSQPFQNLLMKQFEGQNDWQLRYVMCYLSKYAY